MKITVAGGINTFLWSLIISIFTTKEYIQFEKEYWLIIIYLVLAYSFLHFLLWIGFQFLFKIDLAYILSNIPISFLFFWNYIFVLLFGKQLGLEGLIMMLRGWNAGELGDFTPIIVSLLLIFFGINVLMYLTYYLFFKFLSKKYISFFYVILIPLPLFYFHFQLVHLSQVSISMEKWKHKIPWQSITGFPEDKITIVKHIKDTKLKSFQFYKNPPENPDTIELNNVLAIKKNLQNILNKNLTIKNPYNILFINVEGFRYDMLNPNYTPNLYEFANKFGIILKKHYSTGNNTPGGLIGMFTGLSPYYFEPMRQNQVPNPPLELLKKLGYRQSIYYNSPKNYEYIYRDFLERTEGNFYQIPGRVEDYAIREKKLIDLYLHDLERDLSNQPRFDYYLINVTHFNYYYPPEFEVFRPAFTMDFEIISGRQEKFQAHKNAIMNRYLNSLVYFDYLFGYWIEKLIKMGRLKNTIIIIAGDHGEEFWEYGSFGHTWGLNNKQIQTAAVIYFPGIQFASIQYKYSSHSDFFPTVFDILGLNLDTKLFMTGKSLLRYNKENDYAVSSLGVLVSFKRNQYAIVSNGFKVLFKNGINFNESITEIYTDEDEPIDKIDPYQIIEVLEKIPHSKFLKISRVE